MGCRILYDKGTGPDREGACFIDSTDGIAFGPIMEDLDEAEAFRQSLEHDPRRYDVVELVERYNEWRKAEKRGPWA